MTTTSASASTAAPNLTTFYVLHRAMLNAMLNDAERLATAVAPASGADRRRKLPAMVRWYSGYILELHDHHTIEDEVFFPALAGRVAEFDDVSGRLADDHDRLDASLSRTQQAIERLSNPGNGWGAPYGEAVDATRELAGLLRGHLGFENTGVVPLFGRHFDADEYGALELRAKALMTTKNLTFALPWMVEATTAEERAGMMASAPLAFKLLWYASRGRYRRLAERAFAGVATPDAADPISPTLDLAYLHAGRA
jgi:hypothetical protein